MTKAYEDMSFSELMEAYSDEVQKEQADKDRYSKMSYAELMEEKEWGR